MNTNSKATTVLCYGDSNTWGQKPDKTGRYPADIRWTGVLQRDLGIDEYYIIEEGLSSRTTDLEYSRKPGRNGKAYLMPCIGSHNPLDVVLIMLGTNDLKTEFNRSAADIAEAVSGLVDDVQALALNRHKSPTQVVIVSPILVDGQAPDFQKFYSDHYDDSSVVKSQMLAELLHQVAYRKNCHFVNAADVAHAGTDGIHFDEASHLALGKLLAEYIANPKF